MNHDERRISVKEEENTPIIVVPGYDPDIYTLMHGLLVGPPDMPYEFLEKKSEIEKVFSQCRALNDHRVRIAHGLWTGEAHGLTARHFSRTSLEIKIHYQNLDELQKLTQTAEHVKFKVLALCSPAVAPILEKERRSRRRKKATAT
jgi:hypothetical protein